MKYYENIYSISYRQENAKVSIFLTSDIRLDIKQLKEYFESEVNKEFSDIDFTKIEIVQVDSVEKTIAGKNKTLI